MGGFVGVITYLITRLKKTEKAQTEQKTDEEGDK